MQYIILIGIILTIFILGIIFLAYWVPKKFGYPKTGKYIAIIVALLIIFITMQFVFGDELFSKTNAAQLLSQQDVQLNDDFQIEENKSMFAIGDYYHTFTLTITTKDKNRIINKIITSANFNDEKSIENDFGDRLDYYTGPKKTRNYETEHEYILELFEPMGKGYSPIFRKIKIDKKYNRLVFEDIQD